MRAGRWRGDRSAGAIVAEVGSGWQGVRTEIVGGMRTKVGADCERKSIIPGLLAELWQDC